ncbi:COG4315 family predicted lipoprotein [Glaciimonas soli]|uniref:Lipoprotein with Yx(FWY)xxD motif n=1 Tax=Glaciimonas soli TaxID=2590999 RepID=A0A843YNP7_9BURK|nr:hypothetical protein [Glaciimonas soli]MQR01469.1 hypothetical protein [Glaciimonas soli]
MLKTTILLLACASFAASVFAEAPMQNNGKWVDKDGHTLYVFDKDTMPGKSACDANCSSHWPPALADASDKGDANWSFVQTADGKRQWAYKGHPLYRFMMDEKAGDEKGDGKGGMWHTAKP